MTTIKFPKWEREEVEEILADALVRYNEQHHSTVKILSISKETKYHFIAWLSNEDHLELTFLTPKEEKEMYKLYKQGQN